LQPRRLPLRLVVQLSRLPRRLVVQSYRVPLRLVQPHRLPHLLLKLILTPFSSSRRHRWIVEFCSVNLAKSFPSIFVKTNIENIDIVLYVAELAG
jgi:hypothetical protein